MYSAQTLNIRMNSLQTHTHNPTMNLKKLGEATRGPNAATRGPNGPREVPFADQCWGGRECKNSKDGGNMVVEACKKYASNMTVTRR